MRTLDLCIPAYNEAAIIADSIRAVRAAVAPAEDLRVRIFVADNGSTDGTADIVRSLGLADVEVLEVPTRGKGAALVHTAHRSDADYYGFVDADLSADPAELLRLVDALETADVVIGSRLLDEHAVTRSYLRTLSSKVFNLARRMMLGISVADTQCGIKLMNARGREVKRVCLEEGWFLDLEFLARAERSGLTIVELPVSWDEYRYPSRVSKLKVLRDGFGALIAMARIRRSLGSSVPSI